jgi:hypothetical protein
MVNINIKLADNLENWGKKTFAPGGKKVNGFKGRPEI